MANARPHWQLADLIDYEFFLDADEREGSTLHPRDRELYLKEVAPSLGHGAPEVPPATGPQRRGALRLWTDGRRKQIRASAADPEATLLPGEAFSQVRGSVAFALAVLGLVIGWTAAAAALAYKAGEEPINAFVFFVEFALVQVLILVGAFAVAGARWWFPEVKIPSLARVCVRAATGVAAALWARNRVRIAGTRRQNAEALLGVLRARHALYRGVLVWSLVALTQVFAIGFNAGVLGAMTARHLFHDLDFGWESTWLNAAQVSQATEAIATPWSWSVKPGYPNASQVAGSQNRKRGQERLDGESLKSWSQFLFGVVIVYGLLPRLGLLLLAARAQRARLQGLAFNDGRSALTLGRMLTPIVQTHGAAGGATTLPEPALGRGKSGGAAAARMSATARAGSGLLVLNLTGYPLTEASAALAANRSGVNGAKPAVDVFEPDTGDEAGEKRTYAALAKAAAAEAEVLALLASWVPPMIATRLSLDQLRAAVGPERLVTLLLVGKPAADGTFKPVRPADRELWVKAVRIRADPYLAVAGD